MDIWNDRWHDGCIFHYHTIIKTSTFLQKSYSLFSGNFLSVSPDIRASIPWTSGSQGHAEGGHNSAKTRDVAKRSACFCQICLFLLEKSKGDRLTMIVQ